MKIRLPYGLNDPVAEAVGEGFCLVDAEEVEPGVARLTAFGGLFPLAPSDTVKLVGEEVVDVGDLRRLWMFEVFCNIPLDSAADDGDWATALFTADETERQLTKIAEDVYRSGNYTIIVATTSPAWFGKWVEEHPNVFFVEVMRTPTTGVTWLEMQRSLHDERPSFRP